MTTQILESMHSPLSDDEFIPEERLALKTETPTSINNYTAAPHSYPSHNSLRKPTSETRSFYAPFSVVKKRQTYATAPDNSTFSAGEQAQAPAVSALKAVMTDYLKEKVMELLAIELTQLDQEKDAAWMVLLENVRSYGTHPQEGAYFDIIKRIELLNKLSEWLERFEKESLSEKFSRQGSREGVLVLLQICADVLEDNRLHNLVAFVRNADNAEIHQDLFTRNNTLQTSQLNSQLLLGECNIKATDFESLLGIPLENLTQQIQASMRGEDYRTEDSLLSSKPRRFTLSYDPHSHRFSEVYINPPDRFAAKVFKNAEEIDKHLKDTLKAVKNHELERALKSLRIANQLEPRDPMILMLMVLLSYSLGQPYEAINILNRLEGDELEYSLIESTVGDLNILGGNATEAIKCYERAKDKNPSEYNEMDEFMSQLASARKKSKWELSFLAEEFPVAADMFLDSHFQLYWILGFIKNEYVRNSTPKAINGYLRRLCVTIRASALWRMGEYPELWNYAEDNQNLICDAWDESWKNALHAFIDQDFSRVHQHLEDVTDLHPSPVLAYLLIGKSYMLERKYQEAKEAFQKAVQSDPHCLNTYWMIAEFWRYSPSPVEGLSYLEEAHMLDPGNMQTLKRKLKTLNFTGDYVEARDLAEHLVLESPLDHESYIQRAKAYEGLGYFEEALNSYDRAIEVADDELLPYHDKIELVQKRDLLEEYPRIKQKLLEWVPGSAQEVLLLGQTYAILGEYEKALNCYEELSALNPIISSIGRADALHLQDNFSDSRQLLVRAFQENHHQMTCYTTARICKQIGLSYFAEEKFEAALEHFQNGLSHASREEVNFHFWMAQCHEQLEDFETSIENHLAALELTPKNPDIHRHILNQWVSGAYDYETLCLKLLEIGLPQTFSGLQQEQLLTWARATLTPEHLKNSMKKIAVRILLQFQEFEVINDICDGVGREPFVIEAERFNQNQNTAAAIACLQEGIRKHHDSWELRLRLADCLFRLENFDDMTITNEQTVIQRTGRREIPVIESYKKLMNDIREDTHFDDLDISNGFLQSLLTIIYQQATHVEIELKSSPTSFSYPHHSAMEALEECLKKNTAITSLKLFDWSGNSERLIDFAKVLENDDTLQDVRIRTRKVDEDGLIALSDVIAQNNSISTLNIASNQIGKGLQPLVPALKQNHVLVALNLGRNQLGDGGSATLAEGLKMNNSLKRLDLGWNMIGPYGIRFIAEVLEENDVLETLNIRYNEIGCEGGRPLAQLLRVNGTLMTLDVTANELGEEGAKYIATALEGNKTLSILELGWNSIGDSGADAFVETLEENRALTSLGLARNGINDEAASSLAVALESSSTLQAMDLKGNFISEEGATTFKLIIQKSPLPKRVDLNLQHPIEVRAVSFLEADTDVLTRSLRKQNGSSSLKFPGIKMHEERVRFLTQSLGDHWVVTKLILEHNNIEDSGARYLARMLKNDEILEILVLKHNRISGKGARYIASALKMNQTLTSLNLEYNDIKDEGVKYLSEALKVNTSITILDLENNAITEDGSKYLADALQVNETLLTLYLGNNDFRDGGARRLAEALKSNHTLYTLYLGDNHLGSAGMSHLSEMLKTNKSLIHIDVENNDIRESGARELAEALLINKTVATVYIGDNNIKDVGATHIAEAITRNNTVKTLNLGLNKIGDAGAKKFANALKINRSISSLYLGDNKIGDEGAAYLSEGLKSNASVSILYLEMNKIGDAGAKCLADALRVNRSVATLDLETNKIGSTGGKYLGEALKENQTLTTIYLGENEIKEMGAKTMSEALKVNQTLLNLHLGSNKIGFKGAKHLAEALKLNQTLASLDIESNNIACKGAKHLAEALTINSTLSTLYLGGNMLGDKGAKHIAEALKKNKTTATLYMRGNKIGDRGAKHLSEALKINQSIATLNLGDNQIGPEGRQYLQEGLEAKQGSIGM